MTPERARSAGTEETAVAARGAEKAEELETKFFAKKTESFC